VDSTPLIIGLKRNRARRHITREDSIFMDHQTALNSQAAERYTLGELNSSEKEEFEAHFFDCPDCTAALKEYETFAANARAVFRDEETKASQPAPVPVRAGRLQGIRYWFSGVRVLVPALAALVLAFVLFRPAGKPLPDPTGPAVALTLAADVRNEAPHKTIASDTAWITLSIDLVSGMGTPNRWADYHWEIRDSGDNIVQQGKGRDGGPELALPRIAVSKFDSGKPYRLIVQGAPGTKPVTGNFIIDRK
jgi:hypothetical protein